MRLSVLASMTPLPAGTLGERLRNGWRNSPLLPPRLGEPFGGSTSLVDVGVDRQSHDEAIGRPPDGPSLPLMDLTVDADRTTLLVDHRKHDPVVEHDELFDFKANLGEGAEPFVQEVTNCRSAFEKVPRHPPVKDRIASEEAQYRVDVTLIRRLKGKARKLHQIGGRGLLRHRAWEYPADGGHPTTPRAARLSPWRARRRARLVIPAGSVQALAAPVGGVNHPVRE